MGRPKRTPPWDRQAKRKSRRVSTSVPLAGSSQSKRSKTMDVQQSAPVTSQEHLSPKARLTKLMQEVLAQYQTADNSSTTSLGDVLQLDTDAPEVPVFNTGFDMAMERADPPTMGLSSHLGYSHEMGTTPPPNMPPASAHLPIASPKAIKLMRSKHAYLDISTLHPKSLHAAISAPTPKLHFTLDTSTEEVVCTPKTQKFTLLTFEDWHLCFATFLAYKVYFFPELTLPLTSYQCFLAEKSVHYKFSALKDFDQEFRVMLSQYPDQSWADPPQHLTARYFTSAVAQEHCLACKHTGHGKGSTQCPVRAKTGASDKYCFSYQDGMCKHPCPKGFSHHCSICKGSHPRCDHYQISRQHPESTTTRSSEHSSKDRHDKHDRQNTHIPSHQLHRFGTSRQSFR